MAAKSWKKIALDMADDIKGVLKTLRSMRDLASGATERDDLIDIEDTLRDARDRALEGPKEGDE